MCIATVMLFKDRFNSHQSLLIVNLAHLCTLATKKLKPSIILIVRGVTFFNKKVIISMNFCIEPFRVDTITYHTILLLPSEDWNIEPSFVV